MSTYLCCCFVTFFKVLENLAFLFCVKVLILGCLQNPNFWLTFCLKSAMAWLCLDLRWFHIDFVVLPFYERDTLQRLQIVFSSSYLCTLKKFQMSDLLIAISSTVSMWLKHAAAFLHTLSAVNLA